MNFYAKTASELGRPANAVASMVAADTTKTIVAARTSHTLYIQKLTYVPTTVAAQAITLQDTTTGNKYGLIPASQATPYTLDFGEQGIPVTAGEGLKGVPASAGPAGNFVFEGYQKLTSVLAYDSANA